MTKTLGRARIDLRDDGGEVWEIEPRVATRLVELGASGVGGFTREGDTLVRARATTLAAALDGRRTFDWRDAVSLCASLADAASACERAALFPGPLEPDTVTDRGTLLADPLIAAMCGAAHVAREPRARWLAPEQASGAPPDNASNRYALGLVLYVLLSGEHPFAGRGLRLGLDDQASRGAPPFSDALASSLPPGLQSLCLRLLDPVLSRRPASASSIASDLRRFLDPVLVPSPAPVPLADAPVPAPIRRAVVRRAPGFLWLLPLAAGIAIAACVLTRAPSASPRAVIPIDRAMGKASSLSDCASCHPREAAQWSRSVMAHAVTSPLFQSLEMLIEEQVGRSPECPDGAGILRRAGSSPCTDPRTGLPITGSGGALWCVNCHAPGENLTASLPAWSVTDQTSRRPLRDLLPASTQEGISCVACHEASGPVRPGDLYQGNPSWVSARTGLTFSSRPEDATGVFGIANSGYHLDPRMLAGAFPHQHPTAPEDAYLRSSQMCGACHDVRLFGTDALSGEPFKRLRNAYSEWATWADGEKRAGRTPSSCQDCHMSQFPGVCVASTNAPASDDCPAGTVFEARAPGTGTSHDFTGVDVPLAPDFDPAAITDASTDVDGSPLGVRERRDLLLARAVKLSIDPAGHAGNTLAIPIVVENVGAGHRVPAGFSQERELWIHLTVKDAAGAVVYEVGRVDRGDEDLHDKVFLHVNDTDELGDGRGLFGADVADGRDVPRWDPNPALGGIEFHGEGLINFQNGFLRCVSCLGPIDASGRCEAGATRAADLTDGDYIPETGECRSNLQGRNAFLETYFPVGALDATRGTVKAPDAIIDTRSLPPGQPIRYVYDLNVGAVHGPFSVEATLEFRAFPPYLVRAFVDYEAAQAARGARPSGPLIDAHALDKLEVVHVTTAKATIP